VRTSASVSIAVPDAQHKSYIMLCLVATLTKNLISCATQVVLVYLQGGPKNYVRRTMSVSYIILLSWLSVCQKLWNLVEVWQSSNKNKLRHFWTALYSRFTFDRNSFFKSASQLEVAKLH